MTYCEACQEWTRDCGCYRPILCSECWEPSINCLCQAWTGDTTLIEAGNPVRLFFEYMIALYQAFPPVIQALIGMVLLVTVFFGLMLMIRS